MADIKLIFGVDPSSKASIESGLNSLIAGIKPKVKVDFDTGSIKSAYTEYKRVNSVIVDLYKEIDRLSSGANPNAGVYAKQLEGLMQDAKMLKDLMREAFDTGTAGTQVNAFSTELNSILSKVSDIKGVFATLEGGNYMRTITQGTAEYEQALGRVESKVREVSELQSSINNGNALVDESTAQRIEDVSQKLNDLKNGLDGTPVEQYRAQIANLTREIADLHSKTTEPIRLLGEDPTRLAQTTAQVQSMINSVSNLQDKLKLGRGVASAGTTAELEQMSTALRKLSGELETMSAQKAEREIAQFRAQLAELNGQVRASGSIFTTAFRGFGAGITQYLATTLSWMRIIQTTIQEVKQMVSTAIELDDAFTQLQIVTRVSDAEMDAFASTLASTAKNMSASVKDLTEVATVYSRLGYTLDESNLLAQYTAMIQNVGDIDPSSASDAITAIVKAFGMNVEDIESVMDKMVEVGNNFPISVSQIAEGMNNAASMMANAGMQFDESVALLTAANVTTQNISKSSTALRTIIARLRNVKSELDDAGEVWNEAKYQELVSALTDGGVQLQDAAGELRNPYEVLKELAERWSSLSSDVQAAITTALAGTRQQDVFSSLMTQFGEATGAMEAMADSAGALSDAYGIFEDSMTGHINKLKAAFQELSREAVDRGFVNSIVDLGTSALEVITPLVGALGDLLSLLGPFGSALAAISAIGIGKNFGKTFALYSRKAVLRKPSNCGETLTPLCYNVVLTDKRDSRRKAERNGGWPMLNNNAKGCMTMSNPQPSPSPLSGLHHVGMCDEREGSQTVRGFALAAA